MPDEFSPSPFVPGSPAFPFPANTPPTTDRLNDPGRLSTAFCAFSSLLFTRRSSITMSLSDRFDKMEATRAVKPGLNRNSQLSMEKFGQQLVTPYGQNVAALPSVVHL